MSESENLRILSLRGENVMKLTVVEITPHDDVVTIGGENEAGKSAVLNLIEMTMRGAKHTPDQPIRRGAAKADMQLGLGPKGGPVKFTVARTISQGTDRLKITGADGDAWPRPQTLLEGLYAAIAFDPMEFARMSPEKQAETLRKLLPDLDLSALDAAEAKFFEERTGVGRDGKAVKARLDAAAPHFPDAPAEELSVTALAEELAKLKEEIQRGGELGRAAARADAEAMTAGAKLQQEDAAVERARTAFDAAIRSRASAATALNGAMEQSKVSRAAAAAFQSPDIGPAKARLEGAEATNRQVRANAARAALEKELAEKRAEHDTLTKKIEAIAGRKSSKLAAVKMPVEGLALQGADVMLDGLPFKQASTARKITVGVAMALAMNPKLRVILVRDASLITEKNLALLKDLAREHDCQCWIEDARTTDPAAIIIEDGHVRGADGIT